MASLPLEDGNHYERDRITQHSDCYDEQKNQKLGKGENSTIHTRPYKRIRLEVDSSGDLTW